MHWLSKTWCQNNLVAIHKGHLTNSCHLIHVVMREPPLETTFFYLGIYINQSIGVCSSTNTHTLTQSLNRCGLQGWSIKSGPPVAPECPSLSQRRICTWLAWALGSGSVPNQYVFIAIVDDFSIQRPLQEPHRPSNNWNNTRRFYYRILQLLRATTQAFRSLREFLDRSSSYILFQPPTTVDGFQSPPQQPLILAPSSPSWS